VLELLGITKWFGAKRVLDQVSCKFELGSRTLITGANGAGKTTLLRVAGGYLAADSGKVTFLGEPLGSRNRSKIVYLGEKSQLYPALSVRENLHLRGLNEEDIQKSLSWFRLTESGSELVRNLSSGQRYKAALVAALASEPEVLLLDEPLGTLDDQSRKTLAEVLQNFPGTVIVVSHERGFFTDLRFQEIELRGGRI